jgi:hypothetical protein
MKKLIHKILCHYGKHCFVKDDNINVKNISIMIDTPLKEYQSPYALFYFGHCKWCGKDLSHVTILAREHNKQTQIYNP